MKTADGYARFSSKKQGKGDSPRRQTDGWAEDWCNQNGASGLTGMRRQLTG